MAQNTSSRALLAMAVAILFAFMGIGVVDPILPTIASAMGASHWETEMLFTSYLGIMALAMLLVPAVSTRIGAKRTMVIALAVAALSAAACGFMDSIWPLAIARGFWGLGNAFFTPTALSLLIGISPSLSRGITIFEAGIGLGVASGPLLGGFLGGINYHMPFFGTAVMLLLACLACLFWVKDAGERESPQPLLRVFAPLLHPPFLIVSLTAALYYYAYFTILSYSPLYLNMEVLTLGLVFFGWGLGVAVGSVFIVNYLLRFFKVVPILLGSLLAMLICFAVILTSGSMGWATAAIILVGIPSGICNALYTAVSVEVSPYTRSVSTASYNFLRWIGSAIAPVMAGFLGQAYAPEVPYEVAVGMVIVAGLVLFVLRHPLTRAQERAEAGSH